MDFPDPGEEPAVLTFCAGDLSQKKEIPMKQIIENDDSEFILKYFVTKGKPKVVSLFVEIKTEYSLSFRRSSLQF